MTVSVIIPTLNEAHIIEDLLRFLQTESPLEILVADGGSNDGTVVVAARYARTLQTPAGRARQMNVAAAEATGDILWFLHADAIPDAGAIAAIRDALADPLVVGGNLRIEYAGGDRVAKVFSVINDVRCRFGVFYGDSGIFCRRTVFENLGGFQQWPILEDYQFARRMLAVGKVRYLAHTLRVSDRRWRKQGVLFTMWTWFFIQALYMVGIHPRRLARWYENIR